MQRAILIEKCDDKKKWYSNLVGKFVPFQGMDSKEYRSREPAGYINFVSIKDGKLIESEIDLKLY